MEFVSDLALVLLAALAGGFVAQQLKQPLIVGYIVAGIAIGPFTGGPTVANAHDLEQLAELGVVLLLFALGLELSFRELASVRTVALAGGTAQIALTIVLGFGFGRGLGWDWRTSLWFGSLISLSSTMVALKTIQAQGRLGTLSSRVMLGLLVVQDLAVVPLMIVLPELSNPAGGMPRVVVAAGRALLLLGAIVFFSTRVVPRMMAFVAKWNSRELFFLATITLAVGIGYVAYMAGLSMALGAFVAGLVVNESEYSHQALSDVIPLRDLFGMLFFVSIGMLLDPGVIWRQMETLPWIIAAVIAGKVVIFAAVVRLFGYRNVIPLAAGLTLFQVGEFAFVLARVGLSSGALSNDVYAVVLNTAIVTMALTPVVSGLVPALYERLWPKRQREQFESANLPATGLSDHIVIAGAGRVGRGIAEALRHVNLPFVLIESDDRHVRQARDAKLPVIYGDASQAVVLEAARLGSARAMLVTVPAVPDVRGIVDGARRVKPGIQVIARAESLDAVRELYTLGIQEVTSPEFEAAIEMTRQALMYCQMPAHEVLQVARTIRHQQYGLTEAHSDSAMKLMSDIGEIGRQLEFTWVGLPAGSRMDGRTLEALRVRTTTGASVVGIIRHGALISNPDGAATLMAGDLIAILGTREQIDRFQAAARTTAQLA